MLKQAWQLESEAPILSFAQLHFPPFVHGKSKAPNLVVYLPLLSPPIWFSAIPWLKGMSYLVSKMVQLEEQQVVVDLLNPKSKVDRVLYCQGLN